MFHAIVVRTFTIGCSLRYFDGSGYRRSARNDPYVTDQHYNPNSISRCDCADVTSNGGTTGKIYRNAANAAVGCLQNEELGGLTLAKHSDELSN